MNTMTLQWIRDGHRPRLLRIFMVLVMAGISSVAPAETQSEIRAKIQRLENEIEVLKKKLSAPAPAAVPIQTDVVDMPLTAEGAILCGSPLRIKEAYSAVIAGDEKWLKSLDCISAKAGLSVIVIERNTLGWQVRLRLPNGDGVTLWGDRLQFRSPAGEYLNDYGRPIPKS